MIKMAIKSKLKWKNLISEHDDNVSLGRIAFWIILGYMCVFWAKQWEIPETLFWSWTTIVGYNLIKKPISITQDYLVGKKITITEEGVQTDDGA